MIRTDTRGLPEIKSFLRGAGREMPFVMAYTLTQMGFAAKQRLRGTMDRYIDRPTPWAMNSILLIPATKERQRSVVWIKDQAVPQLAHHIEGGQRPAKRFEKRLRSKGILSGSNQYVVPAKRMKLDRYGNVSRGIHNKILSALGAQLDPYANTTTRSLKRNPSQGKYFVSPRGGGLPGGIFELVGPKSDRDLKPVFFFVKKTIYEDRWPFYEVGEDYAYDAMPAAAAKAMKRIGL